MADTAAAGRELLLLRHGIADERDPLAPPAADAARALTIAGRRRTRAVVERLAALGLRADRLLASPLRRAQDTAELAIDAGLADGLELCTALAPGGDVLPLLETLCLGAAGGAGWGRLLLVGHEPDLTELAARLLGAPAAALQLKNAGLIQLTLPPSPPLVGRASLVALLTPRLVLQEQR
ncbi:MAG: phosphohistidine phosphatase SixA [Prochlorococcaceae cyanobacterium]